ncbi:peroxisome biogenesis factor 2 isoform X2 [Oryzias melastigma]|uniref:peroxisome biogenesis factor 2 isoform X2 n=1 Tax=Oryzias melastigma TaxID=30732 RepID=UPI00168D51CB|nr:peroxisome biogenesis factor 2 isoform X2 [Oryzias melastigma]
MGLEKTAAGPDPHIPVLRINQLDALELDAALEQLLWTRFSHCFQSCRPGLLTPVEPELRAFLYLLLWRFTLFSNSATVGQSLLSLRYHRAGSSSPRYRPLSPGQKFSLALLAAGPRWFQDRSHSLLPLLGLGSRGSTFESDDGNGRHPILPERITGAQAVFSKPNVTRDVTYQYMNRELLWHGFADFLIFLLPLLNTRKLKTAVSSFVFGEETSDRKETGERRELWKECGLCGEWPTMPHTVGCQHVFCYYCIKSHSIADACLTCPKCGAEARQPEPLNVEVQAVSRKSST